MGGKQGALTPDMFGAVQQNPVPLRQQSYGCKTLGAHNSMVARAALESLIKLLDLGGPPKDCSLGTQGRGASCFFCGRRL